MGRGRPGIARAIQAAPPLVAPGAPAAPYSRTS